MHDTLLLYTLATRCPWCTMVTLKYTEASPLSKYSKLFGLTTLNFSIATKRHTTKCNCACRCAFLCFLRDVPHYVFGFESWLMSLSHGFWVWVMVLYTGRFLVRTGRFWVRTGRFWVAYRTFFETCPVRDQKTSGMHQKRPVRTKKTSGIQNHDSNSKTMTQTHKPWLKPKHIGKTHSFSQFNPKQTKLVSW